MLGFETQLFYEFILVAQVGWMKIIIAAQLHPEWKSLLKFLQTSGNSLYSCPICVMVKFRSWTWDANTEGTWPVSFVNPTTQIACILPRNLRIFFTLSFISHAENCGYELMFSSYFILAQRHTCSPSLAPMTISVSFPLGLDWWKALNSLLKFISLISFSVHFVFPCPPKLRENNSICLCYRRFSSLPTFTLPYFQNH